MGLFTGTKAKKLAKELTETKKQLERMRQEMEESIREQQELEISLWKMETEIRKYQHREKRAGEILKYEYWKRIAPLYTMNQEELKRIVRLDNLFYDSESDMFGVVESYCLQCGKALQARYFGQELEALRYMAVRQALGIAPAFDTCMECYRSSLEICA